MIGAFTGLSRIGGRTWAARPRGRGLASGRKSRGGVGNSGIEFGPDRISGALSVGEDVDGDGVDDGDDDCATTVHTRRANVRTGSWEYVIMAREKCAHTPNFVLK